MPQLPSSCIARKAITKLSTFRMIPDALALKMQSFVRLPYIVDLRHPRTFNEKLQWLKLHDHNPLYSKLVDKAEAKEWVAKRIGQEYIIPTIGIWDSFNEIVFTDLPERFVLKCTHDSGGLVICRNRSTFDVNTAREKIEKSLSRNYYWSGREWPYKDVKPRIIAEEYISPESSCDLPEYRLFRFSDGRIITALTPNRFTEVGLNEAFFDREWRPIEFSEGKHPSRPNLLAPPYFGEMGHLISRLANRFHFTRVNFYESGGRLLFGDLTFCLDSDFERFASEEYGEALGSWIELPGGGGWLLVTDSSLLWLHGPTLGASSQDGLTDYKFMCFGGKVRCAFTCTGRAEGDLRVDFFDPDWNHLPFTRHYPNADVLPARPRHLREMMELAERLAEGIPFVRVDFYEQGDRVLFGEMTFYPGSGFEEFDPEEWDEKLGSWININDCQALRY